MPPVVAAVGAFVNAALVTTLGTGLAFTVGVYAVNALGYIAVQSILNSAIKSLTKRPKSGEARGLEVTVTDSAADGRILYGTVRVGGANVIPPLTSGTSGKYLSQVIALAIHEIDSYQAVYFWQDEIPIGSITGVSYAAGDGAVTSGIYAGKAFIRCYTGTATQNVDWALNNTWPSTFTSDFRGRGITYAALSYDWGDGKTYQGAPAVTFKVKGAKVYDPRLDSTNGGSGSHRYATPSTWAWSDNPALCWANYKMASYGFAEDGANIDWPSVIAAADICDALVNIPGSLTEKRYRLNGVLLATNDPRDNEKKILDAMLGHMTFVNGKWTVHAGAWSAASYTIEKEDWLAISEIQTVAERDGGRWNRARCWFVDPDRNWQRVESFPRYNDTYKADDAGERIDLEIEQPLCTSEYQAQRVAEVVLRQSRNGQRLVGTLPPRFQRMATFETVALNFDELGWVSKTFRIVSMDINPDGSVNVALIEEQSADWTDMAAGDYGTASLAPIPSTNPTTPGDPQNFTITPDLGTLKFDWDPPTVVPLGTRYRIIQSPGSASAVQSGTVVYDGLVSDAIVRITSPVTPYWYHVQAYVGSYFGPYTPNTFGTMAVPYLNADQFRGNRAFPDGEFSIATNSYWVITMDTGANSSSISNGQLLRSIWEGRGGFRFTRTAVSSTGSAPFIGSFVLEPYNPFNSVLDNWNRTFPIRPGQLITCGLIIRCNSRPAAGYPVIEVGGATYLASSPASVTNFTSLASAVHTISANAGGLYTAIATWAAPNTPVNAFVLNVYENPANYPNSGTSIDILTFQASVL